MDNTEERGSKPIDTIAASYRISKYVEGSKLIECNDIIFTDHRSYIVDINIEDYFNNQLSGWDEINRVMLNPSRRSHRIKFTQSLDEQLQKLNIENIISSMIDFPTNEQIKRVDEIITSVLVTATKTIQGMKRNIPFSHEKETVRAAKLF